MRMQDSISMYDFQNVFYSTIISIQRSEIHHTMVYAGYISIIEWSRCASLLFDDLFYYS